MNPKLIDADEALRGSVAFQARLDPREHLIDAVGREQIIAALVVAVVVDLVSTLDGVLVDDQRAGDGLPTEAGSSRMPQRIDRVLVDAALARNVPERLIVHERL